MTYLAELDFTMRRILLTSSQVSVLLSSLVSKCHLPPFHHQIPSNKLLVISCGTALFLSGYVIQQRTLRDLRSAIRPRQPRVKPAIYLPDQFKQPPDAALQVAQEQEQKEKHKISLVEVHSSEQEIEEKPAPSEKMRIVEALMAQVAQKSWAVEHPDPLVKSRVPITAVERRRLIKEEIRNLAQGDEKTYYQRRLW